MSSRAFPKSQRVHNNSPKSSLPTPGARGSPGPVRSLRGRPAGPPTPESPKHRFTRKHAATIASEEEEWRAKAGALASRRVGMTGSEVDIPAHLCLCQPDPKIPRPRNAFILYRQHYQAAVVAKHPGLSNPEISKIIGEEWRSQPAHVKSQWKQLAEDEKLRHQQQYPDYRYQPQRRSGRRSSASEATSSPDKYRCNKCGGRTTMTTGTPFSNAYTPTPLLPPPTPSSAHATPTSRYLPMLGNLGLSSPGHKRGARSPPPSGGSASSCRLPRDREDSTDLLSPDPKRRRFEQNYQALIMPPPRPASGSMYPHANYSRRESLPRPDQLLKMNRVPSMTSPRLVHRENMASAEAGPTLAPLRNHDQSRSVEAMVMSMSEIAKIRTLGRIAPSLQEPGPASPSVAIRGSIVAVEGEDETTVRALVQRLAEDFNTNGEHVVKCIGSPRSPAPGRDVTLKDIHILVSEWQDKNKEMIKFITTAPEIASGSSKAMQVDTRRDSAGSSAHLHGQGSSTPSPGTPSSRSSGGSPETASTQLLTPVLLIPHYQLATTDSYACRIPITDAYSPAEHWQWVATQWRGIVGPDVTIYIKNVGTEGMAAGKSVEVYEKEQVVVVRTESGSQCIEDSTLRRVKFELGELVAGVRHGIVGGGLVR